jgi:hypothetical protein
MSQFGFMTIKGNWNREPSGIFTYSAEYPDNTAGMDIYDDLRDNAIQGRRARWMGTTNGSTVIASGIYPGVISDQECVMAAMSIENWHVRDTSRGGAEAVMPIEGSIPTTNLFDSLRTEASKTWETDGGRFAALGYVAVCNLQLFKTWM